MEEVRFCKVHGETQFVLRVDGSFRCKKCSVEAVQKRRERLKVMSVEYKGGSCEICGYNKCVDALDFHHVNPEEKDYSISAKGYTRSWDLIKKELDKCILLCSNCHREIHHKHKEESTWDLQNENDKKKLAHDSKYCSTCGKELYEKTKTGLCKSCYYKTSRKVNWPSKEDLYILINEKTFTEIGRIFGVTDSSIKKWCKSYGLPYRKIDLNKEIK